MSDAIDRQVAIDAFGGSLCASETESGREYGISFSGVERILKSLPSAQQWIPVTERLPEIMATVLITNGGNSIEFGRLNNDDGWEWLFEAGYDYWAKCPAPEAWMPLPEPWRGDKDEKEDTRTELGCSSKADGRYGQAPKGKSCGSSALPRLPIFRHCESAL